MQKQYFILKFWAPKINFFFKAGWKAGIKLQQVIIHIFYQPAINKKEVTGKDDLLKYN